MIAKAEYIKSQAPATKADIEQLREDLQVDMTHMEARMDEKYASKEVQDEILVRLDKHEAVLDSILAVLASIDFKLTILPKLVELLERVDKLEDDVHLLKQKVLAK